MTARRGSARRTAPPASDSDAYRPPLGAVGSELLAGPTLPAGRLQHLLVLLLPHALAALLDQRTHERCQGSGLLIDAGNSAARPLGRRVPLGRVGLPVLLGDGLQFRRRLGGLA